VRGFTVVELLVVLAIAGLLASFVIPRYAQRREQTYVAAMQSDLRNLATAQETYYRIDGGEYGYTSDLAELEFQSSDGVSVAIVEAGTNGWSARATHAHTPVVCAYYFGDAAPVPPATRSGTPACARP
jgi:type IV pilus assembly protein PilA